jgi:hypothetical protein
VVDVLEAQDLELENARPLTQTEWTKIWARGRRWNGRWENGPRKAFFRIQSQIEDLTGIKLTWSTHELGLELHFAIPELGELLWPLREQAYALCEKDAILSQTCRALYQNRSFRIRDLKKKLKLSAEKIRGQLGAMRVTMRPARRARVEEDRDADDVKAALEEWDTGASVSYVAWLLRCSKPTARAFLERHGRLSGRDTPPEDPPGVSEHADPRACMLLDMFVARLKIRLRAASG